MCTSDMVCDYHYDVEGMFYTTCVFCTVHVWYVPYVYGTLWRNEVICYKNARWKSMTN